MKNELPTIQTMGQKALSAAIQLHRELVEECCYAGYEGSKEDFDRLYQEVYKIALDELPGNADIDQVCEMFHEYQLEQMNGEREVDWYLY